MYWQVFALILDGIVKNICVFDPHDGYTSAVSMAQSLYGPDATAAECTIYPVQIGDTFDGGVFYREGQMLYSIDRVGNKIYEVEEAIAELAGLIFGGE